MQKTVSKFWNVIYSRRLENKCTKIIMLFLICFLCRIPKHYKLAMHVFGLLACCSTLKEMNEVVCSSAVLFCSPCSGANVQKHYNNLQMLMQQRGSFEHEKDVIAEDYRVFKIMLILQDMFFQHMASQL